MRRQHRLRLRRLGACGVLRPEHRCHRRPKPTLWPVDVRVELRVRCVPRADGAASSVLSGSARLDRGATDGGLSGAIRLQATRHLPLVYGPPRRGHRRPPRRPRAAPRAISAVGVHVSDPGPTRPEPSTTPRQRRPSGLPARAVPLATPSPSSTWNQAAVMRRHHLRAALRSGPPTNRARPRARARRRLRR